MFTIFFNDRCLQIGLPNEVDVLKGQGRVYVPSGDEDWADLPIRFECMLNEPLLLVPVDHPQVCFQRLCQAFQVLPAAGGIVANARGDLLLIFRFGRWDLPKGKQEEGEPLDVTALREVQEETGVLDLRLENPEKGPCAVTYHCYHYEGIFMLKQTSWYRMSCDHEGELVPQAEEGIERAEWVPSTSIEDYLKDSYASIRHMMSQI